MSSKLKIYILLWILCGSYHSTIAQCDSAKGFIYDTTTSYVPLHVFGANNNDLSSVDQGVCAVIIRFKHSNIGNINMFLLSPDSTMIQLIGSIGSHVLTSGTIWEATFIPDGILNTPDIGFSEFWENSDLWVAFNNYTRNYKPHDGILEDFDSGPVNGDWVLIIEDGILFNTGEILSFSIVFCDNDVECTPCGSEQSQIQFEKDTICIGEVLDQNIFGFSYLNEPPNEVYYDYKYIVTHNDSIFSIDTIVDFTSYEPGVYSICGMSYLKQDWTQIDTILYFDSLINTIQNEQICGVLSEACHEVTILSIVDSNYIQIDLCTGEIFEYRGLDYDTTGIYYINEQSTHCDSVTILDIELFNSNIEIQSFGNSQLDCNIPIVILFVDSDQDYDKYWYTDDGYFNSNPIGHDTVEVNRAGFYYYVWSNGICRDTTSFEVIENIEMLQTDISSELIGCDTVKLFFTANKDISTIRWILPDGNEVIIAPIVFDTVAGIVTLQVTDVDGCKAITNYLVDDFPSYDSFSFSIDTLNCQNEFIRPIIATNSTIDSFVWIGPNGFYTTNPMPDIVEEGNYKVFLFSSIACDTNFTFEVIKNLDTIDYTLAYTDFDCLNDFTIVTVTPILSDVLYHWYNRFGEELSDNGFFTTTIADNYYLRIDYGNCTYYDSLEIIKSGNYSDFIGNYTDSLSCIIDSVQLLVDYSGSGLNYHWMGPFLFDSYLQNPYVYAQGVYYLEVVNDDNCVSFDTIEVFTSNNVPQINFGENIIPCGTNNISIDVSYTGNITSFSWVGPNGFISNESNPIIQETGIYQLFIEDALLCTNSAELIVYREESTLGYELYSDSINCYTPIIEIGVLIDTQYVQQISWSNQEGYESTTFHPEDIDKGGTYVMRIIDQNDCIIIDSIQVYVDTLIPFIDAGIDSLITCQDTILQLDARNSVIDDNVFIQWTSNNNESIIDENTLQPTISDTGFYYLLLMDNSNGCASHDTIYISAQESFEVFLGKDTVVAAGSIVNIEMKTDLLDSLISKIEWSSNVFLPCEACTNFDLEINNDIVIHVTVTNAEGCIVEAIQNILLDDNEDIYIPTVFSGDDEDGFFLGYTPAVKHVDYVEIYGKWGELIYEKRDFVPSIDNFIWDGTFRNVKLQPSVFVLVVKYQRHDGKVITKIRTITLLR